MQKSTQTALLTAPDDTLNYKMRVSKLMPRSEVVVTVMVTLILNARQKGAQLDHRIFEALNDFIPVDWGLSGQERQSAAPGFERLSIRAVATVSRDQDWNLEQRAKNANRHGLELGPVVVKRSFSQEHVNQVVKELRFEAVRKVVEELPEFDKASGRIWRIGDISIGLSDDESPPHTSKRGLIDDRDDRLGQMVESGLAGVEKITLVANVTLKSGRMTSMCSCDCR